jgi:hypothetical protein
MKFKDKKHKTIFELPLVILYKTTIITIRPQTFVTVTSHTTCFTSSRQKGFVKPPPFSQVIVLKERFSTQGLSKLEEDKTMLKFFEVDNYRRRQS